MSHSTVFKPNPELDLVLERIVDVPLELVSGMVAAHHGTVRIESSEASGTDFIVELAKKN